MAVATPRCKVSRPFRVSEETLGVLSRLSIDQEDSYVTRISDGQIPRTLFLPLNKVLEALGGSWDRKLRGHAFQRDPTAAIEAVLLSGMAQDHQKALGFFETPAPLAQMLVEAAGIENGMRVLEPSVGNGGLLHDVPLGCEILAVEIDPHREAPLRDFLRPWGHVLRIDDFLKISPTEYPPFDAVVMNPPFSAQAEILHVTHAMKFLRPGGKLAAIMSAGVLFREDKRTVNFRKLVDQHHGTIARLPEGSFRESGTDVRTVAVVMTR